MIQAVIFDVDGVLLDTVPYHFQAWKRMFREEKYHFSFADYLEKVNGLPRATGIKNILGNKTLDELDMLATKKQNYYLEFVNKNPPKPLSGVTMLLQKLQDHNVQLAAASSSKNAPFLLEKTQLNKFFAVIIGGSDFAYPKPDPDIFVTAANRLGIEPAASVVIEDAYLGIQAAKQAHMKAIGLLSSQDTEIPKLADITIDSMRDTKKILSFVLNN